MRGSIVGETARALVCECEGKWKNALKYRKHEILLTKRLYNSFTIYQGDDVRDYALQHYRRADVTTRLLQILYSYRKQARGNLAEEMNRIVQNFEDLQVLE